jgi:hypothetical protein
MEIPINTTKNTMIKRKCHMFLMFGMCEKDFVDMEGLNFSLV